MHIKSVRAIFRRMLLQCAGSTLDHLACWAESHSVRSTFHVLEQVPAAWLTHSRP